MLFHDSVHFGTTSILHFFVYHPSVQGEQHRMDLALVVNVRSLFTWGAVGHCHSEAHPLPKLMFGMDIHIFDQDTPQGRGEV